MKTKKRQRINGLVATTTDSKTKKRFCKKSFNLTLASKPRYFVRMFGEEKEIPFSDIENYKSFEIIVK